MKRLVLGVFLLWVGAQGAPKPCREHGEKRQWFHTPEPQSKRQRKAEEEFGEALRELFENNKVSAQESLKILEKACGLRFSNPVKDNKKACKRMKVSLKRRETTMPQEP